MSRRQQHGADLGAPALAYAAQGFQVLPLHYPTGADDGEAAGVLCSCGQPSCGSIGKHPLTPHGLTDATRDPAQLAWWWRRWPNANIGLLTGELADVLDIDGLAGRAALRRWAATHGLRLDGPLARTGSGWHYYLAPTGSGNRAGLLEHVDWRGVGGYAVAPPSRHASGSRYRWLRPLTSDLPEIPAPLQRLLAPTDRQQAQAAPPFRSVPAGHPYGRKALQEELAEVARAPNGRRNHTLYQAGIRLYSLVAGGVLDRAEVQAGLLAAADASRLLADEPLQTRRTLASAERTGLAHPRGVPARDQPTNRSMLSPTRQGRGHQDRERGG
jgi:Bifunctional DNA primase/polymerase, N-terminal